MTDDIVERLRYQRTNSVLCSEAANEIERLRKIIKTYYKADEEYRQEMQDAFKSDEIMEVILRIEWKKAWDELEREALRD